MPGLTDHTELHREWIPDQVRDDAQKRDLNLDLALADANSPAPDSDGG